jgi:YVTN family beta-propeller protein
MMGNPEQICLEESNMSKMALISKKMREITLIAMVLVSCGIFPSYSYADILRVVDEIILDGPSYFQRISPDGTKLYVLGGSNVTVIDTATNSVCGTIDSDARKMIFSPTGNRAYFAGSYFVDVFDTVTGDIISRIPTGSNSSRSGCEGIEYAGNSKIYATYRMMPNLHQKVFEINTTTNSITQTFTVDITLAAFAVRSDGSFVYTLSNRANKIYICNTTTGEVSTIGLTYGKLGHPQDMIISNDDSRLYIANAGAGSYCCRRTLDIIDTSDHSLLSSISYSDATGRNLAITRDDSRMMVGGDSGVEFIDLTSGTTEGVFGGLYSSIAYISADATIGIAGGAECELQVYNLTDSPSLDQEFKFSSSYLDDYIRHIEESPDGNQFYIMTQESIIVLEIVIPNAAPVADVGDDVVVYAGADGTATVELDGSGSFDVDGDELSYFWYEDANEIARGVDPNVLFGVGEHFVELVVDDGELSSEPNGVTVTVVEAIEAVRAYVVPRVINTSSRGRFVISLMQLPSWISKGDIASGSMVLEIGGAIVESVIERSVGSGNRNYVFAFFDRGEVIGLVSGKSTCDVVIAGKLVSGQCIFGRDTVRVVRSNGNAYGRTRSRQARPVRRSSQRGRRR